jgi:methyl-accepting chemotaxis protein
MDTDKIVERIMDTLDQMNNKITTIVTDITELKSAMRERDASISTLRAKVDEMSGSVKVSSASLVKMVAIVCVTAVTVLGVKWDGALEALKKLILGFWS